MMYERVYAMLSLENKKQRQYVGVGAPTYLRRCLTTYTTDKVRTAGVVYPFLHHFARRVCGSVVAVLCVYLSYFHDTV